MKKVLLFSLALATAGLGQYIVHGPGGIVMQLDTLDGFFGIGDTVGTSGRRIMFDFNYPWTRKASAFIVMIDSTLYSNADWHSLPGGCDAIFLRPYRGPISISYDGFVTQWEVPMDTFGGTGTMTITQRLRAILIDAYPAVEISYMVYNRDDRMHRVAFYLNIDVLVGTNDRAPMAVSSSYSAFGDILSGARVPYFWQAFEIGPAAGAGQVVARGILKGIADAPQVFAYGHELTLSNDCWDIDSSVIGRLYYDSGVTMRWDEVQVSPDKFEDVKTIYGYGPAPEPDAQMVVFALVPTSLGAACDHWGQNPFEAAVLVNNVSVTPSIDTITVCIHLDEGLNIVTDPWHTLWDTCTIITRALRPDSTAIAAWLIRADSTYFTFGPTDAKAIITVRTATPGIGPVMETTMVHIPDPGGVPPTLRTWRAPHWATSCAAMDMRLKYYIVDDESIDRTSLIFQLGSAIKYYGDSLISFSGDSAIITVPWYMMQHGRQIYHGVISVSDYDGCLPDSIPLVNYFWVDALKPALGAPYPPDGSIIHSRTSPAIIRIYDRPAGVDSSSILVSVDIDGAFEYYDITAPELSFEEDTLIVFTPLGFWPDSSVVTVCLLSARDRCDPAFCPPNEADSFCYTFGVIHSDIGEVEKPLVFGLSARPNPFNSTVEISASLAERLEIYDISGRLVSDLSSKTNRLGASSVIWNGVSDAGIELPSGVYFARATSKEKRIVNRIILIR